MASTRCISGVVEKMMMGNMYSLCLFYANINDALHSCNFSHKIFDPTQPPQQFKTFFAHLLHSVVHFRLEIEAFISCELNA